MHTKVQQERRKLGPHQGSAESSERGGNVWGQLQSDCYRPAGEAGGIVMEEKKESENNNLGPELDPR